MLVQLVDYLIPVVDDRDNPWAVCAIVVNVTSHKQIETNLQESEQRYASAARRVEDRRRAEDEERKRITQLLHDETAQILAASVLTLKRFS